MSGLRALARFELRRAWATMLVFGLLAGLGAGIALASAQVARRSSTAYSRLEVASGAPDVVVLGIAGGVGDDDIATIPQVDKVWSGRTGIGALQGDAVTFVGIIAGRSRPPAGLFTPIVVEGRNLNPAADDELLLTERIQNVSGLHVGDELPLKFLKASEVAQFDTGFGEPEGPELRMKVVGVVRAALGAGSNGPETFSTPAFARRIDAGDASFPTWLVTLRRGAADVPAFRRALEGLAARATPVEGAEEFSGFEVQVPSLQRPVIANTARVLVAGLLVFGGIAALAALVGVVLALRRYFLAASLPNARALAAIGVTPRQMLWSRLVAALPFVATGVLTTTVIAVAAASIGPVGSLSKSEPHPGWHLNIALVLIGTVVVGIAFLGAAALAAARLSRRSSSWTPATSRVVARVAAVGAPAPLVIGTGLALEPGRGRGALPVRSALVATAVGIAGIVAVMVFASSLHRMTNTPARWGWSADAQVADVNDDIEAALKSDRRIDGYLDSQDFQVRVDDRAATGRVYRGDQALGWTVLDGRRPRGEGEVLLGARLSRTLGKGDGDRVTFRDAAGDPVTLAVVGVGTGPDLSDGQFGGGLVVSPGDVDRIALTKPERNAQISFAPGVDRERANAALGREVELTEPERPPDIDNLAQLGRLPDLLMAFLAVLSVAVLAHSIVVSARRRRREFDTLRAIGFVRRQAHAVIVVAALVSVAVGLVLGVLLGLVLGRVSWSFTAHAAYAAGDVRIPVLGLVALVAGSLVVAFLVAVGPAWRLTRVPIAVGLREE
jgi:hypothetical protein